MCSVRKDIEAVPVWTAMEILCRPVGAEVRGGPWSGLRDAVGEGDSKPGQALHQILRVSE